MLIAQLEKGPQKLMDTIHIWFKFVGWISMLMTSCSLHTKKSKGYKAYGYFMVYSKTMVVIFHTSFKLA